jgi:hypothetical protein
MSFRCLFRPAILIVAMTAAGCRASATITQPYVEEFEQPEISRADWLDTGAGYRVREGKLNVSGAHNHPLWLRRRLPPAVVVEVDAMSRSPDGDLKVELYGDGESFDADQGAYEATSYMFVMGGWHNTRSIIGKLGEHDAAVRAAREGHAVDPGRVYHWTITIQGGNLDWRVDGQPFLAYQDPSPLTGSTHQFFAINNWEADVYFDNLRIRPAP